MILVTVGGSILMMRPFNKAASQQEELKVKFGAREEFIPPPVSLTPDRIHRFLAVRQELMQHCAQFTDIAGSFQKMEELDAQGDDPPVGEILKGVGNIMGSVFSVAGEIGALNHSRNNELLKNEMGLGEYIWIYVLAYNSWLGFEPNTGFEGDDTGGFSVKEAGYIRSLILNHASALEEVGRTKEAKLWREEAGHLERSEGRVPFSSGNLPSEVTAALAPYRSKFTATYCPAMAEFDLGRVKKKGLSFRSD